ncbi:MAG: hypothetical protein WD334_09230, partial [Chitinophagales bacterium]
MEHILRNIASQQESNDPELLAALIDQIRPKDPKNILRAEKRIEELIHLLNRHPDLQNALFCYINNIVLQTSYTRLYSQ